MGKKHRHCPSSLGWRERSPLPLGDPHIVDKQSDFHGFSRCSTCSRDPSCLVTFSAASSLARRAARFSDLPGMTVVQSNRDDATIRGFGAEWSTFDQSELKDEEYWKIFDGYFQIFPFDALPADAEGFDLGCGSGRWAVGVAPRVAKLHCVDASPLAIEVARKNLSELTNIDFHVAGVDDFPIDDGSQDFGYSLGVLHHVPNPVTALGACVRKLKRGSPFLVYLYYRFDNRPWWFRLLWVITDGLRRLISRMPFPLRRIVTDIIAATVYWPFARVARRLQRRGRDVSNVPLSAYRYRSFYTMRTDALDRFGTRLEHRFTRPEIRQMMETAGLTDIVFSDLEPFWVACGRRA
jgi:SAM-dependent methyltransferase